LVYESARFTSKFLAPPGPLWVLAVLFSRPLLTAGHPRKIYWDSLFPWLKLGLGLLAPPRFMKSKGRFFWGFWGPPLGLGFFLPLLEPLCIRGSGWVLAGGKSAGSETRARGWGKCYKVIFSWGGPSPRGVITEFILRQTITRGFSLFLDLMGASGSRLKNIAPKR